MKNELNKSALPISRFDIFNRVDEDGEREVIRLFSKRVLAVEIDLDDVVRENWEEDLPEFLKSGERLGGEVLDFLGEEGDEDEGDEEGEGGGSVVPAKYRLIYGAAQNCGDEIALALSDYCRDEEDGLDREKLAEVASANGIADRLDKWINRSLNGGLLRMNVSNVLRGMNRRGEQVVIGSMVWEAREVPKKPRKSKAEKAAA
jgi:hypothetical protein